LMRGEKMVWLLLVLTALFGFDIATRI